MNASSNMEMAMTYLTTAMECATNNADVILYDVEKIKLFLTAQKKTTKDVKDVTPQAEFKQGSIVTSGLGAFGTIRIISSGTTAAGPAAAHANDITSVKVAEEDLPTSDVKRRRCVDSVHDIIDVTNDDV